MKINITRFKSNDMQTIGQLIIYDFLGNFGTLSFGYSSILECYTLELPDKDNQKFISRIPAGIYECKKRWSLKFGSHIQVLDVPNRTWILIHRGNYFFNSTGCIIVGDSLSDINNDGYQDVFNSNKTLKKMLSVLPPRFTLEIIDGDKNEL